jgi:Thioredoxin-like
VRLLLVIGLFFLSVLAASAGSVPLTAKEIGLMLRSGYSSDAVLRELATRHFADTFDSSVEEQLKRAGANESLLNALRTGSYAATATEISAAKEKAIATPKPTPSAERVVQSQPGPPQKPKFSESAGAPPPAPAPPNAIYEVLKGNLVHLERGELRKLDDELVKKKKLYLFLYSSNSSELARTVTSSLVTFYHRVTSAHPEFETIFFSQDRTASAMESHIHRADMPWPAMVFEKSASKAAGRRVVYEVPYLVLVSGDGRILFSSTGSQNSDVAKVIADLDKVLATSSADPSSPPPLAMTTGTDYYRPEKQ